MKESFLVISGFIAITSRATLKISFPKYYILNAVSDPWN